MFFQFKLKKVQLIVNKLQGVQLKVERSQKKQSGVTKHTDTHLHHLKVCVTHTRHTLL